MEGTELKVGIGDLNVTKPPRKIITVGLGSCIGIVLYDRIKKIAGLSHIMLPDSTQFSVVTNEMKFADLAVPLLVKEMEKQGANKRFITAKIAGGASMFKFSDNKMINDIGKRNGEAVKNALHKIGIPITGEHIGGHKGRTVIVNPEDGQVTIRIVGQEHILI
ncbi:MAG: chemotaxis protein CheD [Clostridium sp.]